MFFLFSSSELCTDFKETLELNKWENWYTDQYLQHFQTSISPGCGLLNSSATSQTSSDAISSPTVTPAPDLMTSPSVSLEDGRQDLGMDSDEEEEDEEDDGLGITFASNVDKDKIIAYLSEGNSVADAERLFGISQSTINLWLSSIKQKNSSFSRLMDAKDEPSEDLDLPTSMSAFSHVDPEKSSGNAGCARSAFSRHLK
jgi:Transposase.